MELSKREKMRRPVSFFIEVYPVIRFFRKHVLTFIFKMAFPNLNFHMCLLKVHYFLSLFTTTAEDSFVLLELPMIKSESRLSYVTGPSFIHCRRMRGRGH
jgi:hypothetical protein